MAAAGQGPEPEEQLQALELEVGKRELERVLESLVRAEEVGKPELELEWQAREEEVGKRELAVEVESQQAPLEAVASLELGQDWLRQGLPLLAIQQQEVLLLDHSMKEVPAPDHSVKEVPKLDH